MSLDLEDLRGESRRWLVTGGAGFIGSHLVQTLLNLGQEVVVLDNLIAGSSATLNAVVANAPAEAQRRFRFIAGSICDTATCREAVAGCDHVLHHAALGSVPGSIDNPRGAHEVNSSGFIEVTMAAHEAGAKSVVFASSSAVYGTDNADVKSEDTVGTVLSPYAATKRSNELFAEAIGAAYGLRTIGLRYFNVYGPRQDPNGAYAAVIPKWMVSLATKEPIHINGDGLTTRDFCNVKDVVQANLRAALSGPQAAGQVFNVGSGQRTTLLDLLAELQFALRRSGMACESEIIHGPFRAGDIRHSQANIDKARRILGFSPEHDLRSGLAEAMSYYLELTAR